VARQCKILAGRDMPFLPPPSPPRWLGWLDRLSRAAFAGLGLAELRAMLRGEPPTERPNPRYKAHINSMLLHIRPRSYAAASTRFTYTFRLGFLAVFLCLVETLTGLLLMLYYDPTPEGAYASILRLQNEVLFGELLRDVHRLAAEALLVVAALHLLRTFLTKSYLGQRRFTWATGVVLFALLLWITFSGYLLPWDQLAYWAVTIGTSLAAAVPWIGERLNLALRGASEIGADGLLRFYLMHILLTPLGAALLLGVHYYRVARLHNISLPPSVEQGDLPPETRQAATRRIDLLPDLLLHEISLTLLATLALLLAAAFFYDAPLESPANPLRTPLATQAPWFFLWVQGLLKLGDKTLWGVLVPAGLFLWLLLLPYLDRNPQRRLRCRPLALPLALGVTVTLGILSYMGTAAYGLQLPPALQLAQRLSPEEGRGWIHALSFDALTPGYHRVGAAEGVSSELAAILAQIDAFLKQSGLPEPAAWLIIEERQLDLKRLTLRVQWQADPTAPPTTYERVFYLHRVTLDEPTPALFSTPNP